MSSWPLFVAVGAALFAWAADAPRWRPRPPQADLDAGPRLHPALQAIHSLRLAPAGRLERASLRLWRFEELCSANDAADELLNARSEALDELTSLYHEVGAAGARALDVAIEEAERDTADRIAAALPGSARQILVEPCGLRVDPDFRAEFSVWG